MPLLLFDLPLCCSLQNKGFLYLDVLSYILKTLLKNIASVLFPGKSKYSYWQNYVYEKLSPVAGELGALIELIDLKRRKLIK